MGRRRSRGVPPVGRVRGGLKSVLNRTFTGSCAGCASDVGCAEGLQCDLPAFSEGTEVNLGCVVPSLSNAALLVTTRVHHLLPHVQHIHCGVLPADVACSLLLSYGDVRLRPGE